VIKGGRESLHPTSVSQTRARLVDPSSGRTDKLLVAVPAVQVLRDAILLAQERLLVHLVEQTALPSPRGERRRYSILCSFGPT